MTKKCSISMAHVILGRPLTNLPCAPIGLLLIFQVPSRVPVIVKPLPGAPSAGWLGLQTSPCNVWSAPTHLTWEPCACGMSACVSVLAGGWRCQLQPSYQYPEPLHGVESDTSRLLHQPLRLPRGPHHVFTGGSHGMRAGTSSDGTWASARV